MDFENIEELLELSERQYEQYIEEQSKKPKMVFKYKSISSALDLSRACDIFQSNKIYMPSLEQLNDPLESRNSVLLGIEEYKRTEQ